MQERQKRSLGARPSYEQRQILLKFMGDNLEFARNQLKGSNAVEKRKLLWSNLCMKLNATGGAKKSTKQWIKFWNDWRGLTRAKASNIKNAANKTGQPGPSFEESETKELSDLEKILVNIMSTHSFDGDGSTPEFGFGAKVVPATLPEKRTFEEIIDKPETPLRRKVQKVSASDEIIQIEREKLAALKQITKSLAVLTDALNGIKNTLNHFVVDTIER